MLSTHFCVVVLFQIVVWISLLVYGQSLRKCFGAPILRELDIDMGDRGQEGVGTAEVFGERGRALESTSFRVWVEEGEEAFGQRKPLHGGRHLEEKRFSGLSGSLLE